MKLTKLLALVMALTMVFSFAACATEEAAETETTTAATETTTEATTTDGPAMSDVTGKFEFAAFSIKVGDKTIDNAAMADATMWKCKDLETVNSKGNASVNTYSGYLLADVLKAAGYENATDVTFVCSDGYEIDFTLTAENTAYSLVALEVNKEAVEEGFTFAPCLETTSSNYAKGVVEIIVNK